MDKDNNNLSRSINRGVELSTDLIESGRTVILDQVENGVAVRMAVLYLLASKL